MRRYGESIALDYDATARFFEERGRRIGQLGPIGAVLYQDRRPELAARRSAHELGTVAPLLRQGRGALSVLDVGCGTGRWAATLEPCVDRYLGLDFCEAFLVEARRLTAALPGPGRFGFTQADLAGGLPAAVGPAEFDTALMAGVLLYLNDADAHRLLGQVGERLRRGGRLYLREPLGIEERLTLASHFSEELDADYSSVYRSRREFESMIGDVLLARGLRITACGPLYPAGLDNRSDTRQHHYVLERA